MLSLYPQFLENWQKCHGAQYVVREEDLLWNLHGQDWLRYEGKSIAGADLLLATATEKGIAHGVGSQTLWVSLWDLTKVSDTECVLLELEKYALTLGKSFIAFGGEEFHLVPGVPAIPCNQALLEALEGLGVKPNANFGDLLGQLHTEKVTQIVQEASARREEQELQFHPVENLQDMDFRSFLQREFPGRWAREPLLSPEDGGLWHVLQNERGEILAFSRVAVRGAQRKGGRCMGAMRLPLLREGKNSLPAASDTCLGPIGVGPKVQGRGYGKIILGLSLQVLREKSGDLICIDWTDAYQYYSGLGFVLGRQYHGLRWPLRVGENS